jgi:hypothetical protein
MAAPSVGYATHNARFVSFGIDIGDSALRRS